VTNCEFIFWELPTEHFPIVTVDWIATCRNWQSQYLHDEWACLFSFLAEEGGANNWDNLNNRLTLVFIPHLDVGEQTPHCYWVPTNFFI
jgi:hypothetical protein